MKGLHADKLADCEFSCLRKRETAQRDQQHSGSIDHYDEEGSEEGDEGHVSQGEPEGLAGGASGLGGHGLVALVAMLGTALAMRGF